MSLQLQRGERPNAEAVRQAILNSAIPCDPEEVEEPERCLLGKLNIPGAYQLLTGEALISVEPLPQPLGMNVDKNGQPSTQTVYDAARTTKNKAVHFCLLFVSPSPCRRGESENKNLLPPSLLGKGGWGATALRGFPALKQVAWG